MKIVSSIINIIFNEIKIDQRLEEQIFWLLFHKAKVKTRAHINIPDA